MDDATKFRILFSEQAEIVHGTDGLWRACDRSGYVLGLSGTWLGAVTEFCRVIQEKRDGEAGD